jgi:arylsulfatase A
MNRWQRGIASILAFGLPMALVGGSAVAAELRPNVIVILTDDQGSVDAACYGSADLQTPAIDALAARGVRFTQFYAAAPVCSPSRAGLLTGRYPVRAGMPGNAGAPPSEAISALEDVRDQAGSAWAQQTTMAEVFQAAGYATAHVGKWHLHAHDGARPLDQGFEQSFGHMGGCIDNYSHVFYWSGPNRHDLWRGNTRVRATGEFFPDLMVREATAFMERSGDRPFFLYFAMNCPHYPYQGEADWLETYADLPFPRNLYAAFLSSQDERIGTLLATLKRLGIDDDTIVVFQSDHGHSTEERAHGGGGSAGPYRGAKFSLFEGGIRVPAIISWPGHLPEGEVREQVAHSCDWLPTLVELCGIAPLTHDVDGASLTAMIRGADEPSPHEALHWTIGESWAVRQGPWKLQGKPNDTSGKAAITASDALYLTNLQDDATEMTNLAAAHPDVVERLQQVHDTWVQSLQRVQGEN